MGVVNIKDFRWMNEDTRNIVDAINHSGKATADKIESMQQSVSELARSVHELAISNNYLAKDVDSMQSDIKQINNRLSKIEPITETMKAVSNIFLRWLIPIMLIGSLGGGAAYTFLK